MKEPRALREILLSMETQLHKSQRTSSWEKVKIVGGIVAAVALPIVLFILSSKVERSLRERDLQSKKLELAVGILKEPATLERFEIRMWAANQMFGDDPGSRTAVISASLLGKIDDLQRAYDRINSMASTTSSPLEIQTIREVSGAHDQLLIGMLEMMVEGQNPLISQEEFNDALMEEGGPYKALAAILRRIRNESQESSMRDHESRPK